MEEVLSDTMGEAVKEKLQSTSDEQENNTSRWTFSNKSDDLLSACRLATSHEDLLRALKDLHHHLKAQRKDQLRPRTTKRNDSSVSYSSSSWNVRQDVACCLLQEILPFGNDNKTQTMLQECFLQCGIMETLLACSSTLRQIATTKHTSPTTTTAKKKMNSPNNDRPLWSPSVLESVLRILKKWICSMDCQYSIWIQLDDVATNHTTLSEIIPSSISQTTPTKNSIPATQEPSTSSLSSLYMERLVDLILRFPMQISNACLALKVQLPTWTVASRYNARVVQCALSGGILQTPNSHTKTFFFIIIQQLLRQKRSVEDAVIGIYHCIQQEQQPPPPPNKNIDETKKSSFLQVFFELHYHHHHHHDKSYLTTSDSALLFKSILQHSISLYATNSRPQQQQQQQRRRREPTIPEMMAIWETHISPHLQWTCKPFLHSVRKNDVRDRFLQICILSSPMMENQFQDRLFCHCVAAVLQRHPSDCVYPHDRISGEPIKNHDNIFHLANGGGIDDDDSSSTSSTDSDSETQAEMNDILEFQDGDQPLGRQVKKMVALWSQLVFLHQTNSHDQHRVTNFLLSAFAIIHLQHDPTSRLVADVLQGVSIRLESSVDSIRRDGMKVGEAIAKHLGEKLCFDELHSSDDDDDDDNNQNGNNPDAGHSTASQAVELPIKYKTSSSSPSRHQKVAKSAISLDPDADYVSEDDDSSSNCDNVSNTESVESQQDNQSNYSDDSIWDNDDNDHLQAYDNDDDEEDLRDVPIPLYLVDCLSQLRVTETEDHACSSHETALKALPDLVRSQPFDLPDLAVPLALQVLRMENKFQLDKFEELKMSCLFALTVGEPLAVGKRIIDVLWEDVALIDRLCILETLSNAAHELTGHNELAAWSANNNLIHSTQTISKASRGKESVLKRLVTNNQTTNGDALDTGQQDLSTHEARAKTTLESRTRRWGTRDHERFVPFTSRFGPVAPVWFYSLLGGFVQRKDETRLWGSSTGSKLLMSLMMTLATLVEYSGSIVPGTNVLARDLFDLAWSLRSADVAEVRMGALIAVGSSLALLDSTTVLALLSDSSHDNLSIGLSEIAMNDPEKDCRDVARVIARNVKSAMESFTLSNSMLTS